MTREARETQLHDRIDELVRELAECERRLQENTARVAVIMETARQAAKHSQNAVDCLRRVIGEAERRPRGAPPNQTPEQIQEGKLGAFGTAEIGRSR